MRAPRSADLTAPSLGGPVFVVAVGWPPPCAEEAGRSGQTDIPDAKRRLRSGRMLRLPPYGEIGYAGFTSSEWASAVRGLAR